MNKKVISDLEKLIGFQSTQAMPQEIKACLDYIEKQLEKSGLFLMRYESNGIPSLVAATHDTLRFDVILNAHIDVVPAQDKAFVPKVKGDRMYGRGTEDMKFAAAIFIDVMKNIQKISPELMVACLFVADEEVGGYNGTRYLLDEIGYRSSVAIIPDASRNFRITQAAKGMLHLRLTTQGKAAHGSRPWQGINALDKAIAIYQRLRKAILEAKTQRWGPTMNLGKVTGGEATNKVADHAELSLDLRFTEKTTKEELLWKIKTIVGHQGKIEVVAQGDCFWVSDSDRYIRMWKEVVEKQISKKVLFDRQHSASDARFFMKYHTPVILSLPVCGGAHTEEEWVSLSSVVGYHQCVITLLQKLRQQKSERPQNLVKKTANRKKK